MRLTSNTYQLMVRKISKKVGERKIGDRKNDEEGIQAVQDAAVPRNDGSRILDPCVALEKGDKEIATLGAQNESNSDNDPICNRHNLSRLKENGS